MRKKWILQSVMILCVSGLPAQQKPHYTQYVLNEYILNPALTGIENYTDVKIGHRRQWAALKDAPVTTYFTSQGALDKKDCRTTATSFQVNGTNQVGNRKNVGWNGRAGINISNTVNLSYPYHYSTSALNTVSNSTHEIVPGFLISNKYGDWCPGNVW